MFFTMNAVDIQPYFLTVANRSLKQGTIMLLTDSTSNSGEEVFMPPIDGEISVWVTSRWRFAQMDVNIPGVIHVLWSALL